MSDEHQMLREKVALEHGFSLYKPYGEKEAAAFLKRDISTLKRWRRSGMFKNKFSTEQGKDGVRYLGTYLADLIIWGTGKWPNEPDGTSPSGNTPSPKGQAPAPGIAAGTTSPSNGPNASAWARQTLK